MGRLVDSRDELQNILGRIILRARADGFDSSCKAGLSASELCVLARLVFDGRASMRDLGAVLSLPRSSMTDVADRLEAKRLLVRASDGRDRRLVVLEATDAAKFTLLQATAGLEPVTRALLSQLTGPETRDLLRLLGGAVAGLL